MAGSAPWNPCSLSSGLGTPLYALFYILPEFERAVSWLANVLPTRAFKKVGGSASGRAFPTRLRLSQVCN